jgi:hypothetical protein
LEYKGLEKYHHFSVEISSFIYAASSNNGQNKVSFPIKFFEPYCSLLVTTFAQLLGLFYVAPMVN